jgi:Zn-dependent M28 family amino/carboxypeptidase
LNNLSLRTGLVVVGLMMGCTEQSAVAPTPTPAPVPLSERMSIEALTAHLDALEGLADANEANRAHLTQGYLDSADYIEGRLAAAGIPVVRESFEVRRWSLDDSTLAIEGVAVSHAVLFGSTAGTASAEIVPVDLVLPPGPANTSTSGCEPSDFVDFPAGAIALLQRGTCTFATKALNAEAAGASAVVLFNEGQPGRLETLEGTLDPAPAIPVVGVSFAVGESLASGGGVATVAVESDVVVGTDDNLIATLPGSGHSEAGVILLGAHLDSVPEGPGVNDNGSGSAFLLELLLQAHEAGFEPAHPVQFAWWGAEEIGLVGSYAWAYDETTGQPDAARLDALDAYLNYDMMASSRGMRFIYDGDGSDIADGGASRASGAIEAVYAEWFADRDLDTFAEGMFVPTDSYWFVLEGVPTGGLFSGAFQYDPCYHLACDRRSEIDETLYLELARAGAHTLEVLAEREGPASSRLAPRQRMPDADTRPRPMGCHDHAVFDR